MCDTYGLDQDSIRIFYFFFSFTAEKQALQIFTLRFPPYVVMGAGEGVGGCGGSAKRLGDIHLHFQGVEGIELPQFPHRGPTEASDQCERCCLSEPLVRSVRHASFPSSLFIQPSIYPKALLLTPPFFLMRDFIPRPPPAFFSLCFPLVNQDIITRRAWRKAPRPSRITCCLPAVTSPLITSQRGSDALFGHR